MQERVRTLNHLQSHHVDFTDFLKMMEKTHAGRFDPVFWSFMERHLPSSPQHILDAGAGPGLFALDLLKRFPQAHVLALEIQPEMMKAARSRLSNKEQVDLLEADIGQPWPSEVLNRGGLDLVVASMVLHELEVPYAALEQAAHSLRPDGRLIIYDWIRQPLSTYLDGDLPDSLTKVTHFSEHCRYTPADYIWMCERVGLSCLDWVLVHKGKHMLAAFEKG